MRGASRDSQVGNARFTDGGGDGFDGGAEGVEELRELPAALGPPAFLHHEAGHGDDIGVESGAVRHGAGDCGRRHRHRHFPRRSGAGRGGQGRRQPGPASSPTAGQREGGGSLTGSKGVPPLRPNEL